MTSKYQIRKRHCYHEEADQQSGILCAVHETRGVMLWFMSMKNRYNQYLVFHDSMLLRLVTVDPKRGMVNLWRDCDPQHLRFSSTELPGTAVTVGRADMVAVAEFIEARGWM